MLFFDLSCQLDHVESTSMLGDFKHGQGKKLSQKILKLTH